ncbi:MAG: radical SAM protein [Promethearchaeota archaeon]
MIDPIELSIQVRNQVSKNDKRKYYRFRKTRFYGGCATADCLGCNLRCAYCWGQKKVWNPNKYGEYYTSREVCQKLVNMKFPLVRLSGGEPTISKTHLLRLIALIPEEMLFILETNGILLDEDFVKKLSKFHNLYVRVSLKGVDESTFEKITGAKGKYFSHQINALKLLKQYNIKNRAALLPNFFTDEQIKSLGIPNLEYEQLIAYPFVVKNLERKGIKIIRNS